MADEEPGNDPIVHNGLVGDARLLCEIYARLRRFAAVVAPPSVEPDDLLQEAFARALRVRPLDQFDDISAHPLHGLWIEE